MLVDGGAIYGAINCAALHSVTLYARQLHINKFH